MIDLSDPHKVHDLLSIVFLFVFISAWIAAMMYLHTLNKFFEELKWKEPDVWASIGNPGMQDMVRQPHKRFNKFYAFLPVLRERASRPERDYHYAGRAYLLLKTGLTLFAIMVAVSAIMIGWIYYHDL